MILDIFNGQDDRVLLENFDFFAHPLFSHNFKTKDQKQTEIVNILRNLLKFLGSIYQNVIVLVK